MQKLNLRNLFANKADFRERRAKQRPWRNKNVTILIVDDSMTILFILKKFLEQDGNRILVACDGNEALKMAKSHMPDLILMDVIMPRINGFRASKMLKNDALTAHIPIIMMSADDQAMEEYWLNHMGAKDYLIKPFERADVFSKIEKFLNGARIVENY